ncbi:MAG: glycosyltransferase family 8 protein [bacterium]
MDAALPSGAFGTLRADIADPNAVPGPTVMNDPHSPSAIATDDRLLAEGHPVVVVCGADDRFAMPLAVTLYSALSNYRSSLPVKVFIIDGGIRAPNRLRVDRVLGELGAVAEWLEPDWRPVQHLAVSDRYPASIFLRLLIPTILPQWVEKAVYLDSDLIVGANIGDLWEVDLGRKALLGVQDEGVLTVASPWGLANYRELCLDPSTTYFNSGVLVFDLRAWRERGLADRVIEYVAAHPNQMRFGEQDALNAVLAGTWGALDPTWNQLVSPWEGHNGRHYQPGILHFVSICKPWNPDGAHWTNFLYDRCLRRSGWYNGLEWWKYYVPLLVQRQWAIYLRSRGSSSRQRKAI